MDRKKKYCQKNTTQSNLHIQHNHYQNNTSILHRARTNNPKIYVVLKKTLNSQINPEKEPNLEASHFEDSRYVTKL